MTRVLTEHKQRTVLVRSGRNLTRTQIAHKVSSSHTIVDTTIAQKASDTLSRTYLYEGRWSMRS